MSFEQLAVIAQRDPAVGIILEAAGFKSKPGAFEFQVGPFSGSRRNTDEITGATTSAYRFYGSVMKASEHELVADVAFEETTRPGVPYSPAPRPVRVAVDSAGMAAITPIDPEQLAALDRLFLALRGVNNAKQR